MQLFFMCNHCGLEIKLTAPQPAPLLSCPRCSALNRIPPQRLDTGILLTGYRILHRIEASGNAECYLAEWKKNRSLVKFQTFSAPSFASGFAADYYLDGMKRWMGVRQPNIIKALEAGRSSNGTFFAASSQPGGTPLEERIWTMGALDIKAAINLALSISRILEWLWNEHGLIYGQLTPRNIILTPDRNILLAHMALAPLTKVRPAGLMLKEFVATTPGFTSPEQFTTPDTLDFRADMYSLGATLYHMLTGSPPFACLTPREVATQHQSPSLADPRLLRPDLPEEVVWLLEILMAHDPHERFDDWNSLISIMISLQDKKPALAQKQLKSHSVLIRLPHSDIAKLTNHVKLKPVKSLYHTPPPPRTKDYFGIILSICVALGATLVIVLAFIVPESTSGPPPLLRPSQRDPIPSPPLASQPVTAPSSLASPPPVISTNHFMALLVETRQFARVYPAKQEEIYDRYVRLLALAETNAPRWVPDLQRQVRALDLAMAVPLDNAERAIRQRASQFEDQRQYQEGILWLEHYSGPFVQKTKPLRQSLINKLKSLPRQL
jgi:serine/threonine-protein kinase